MIKSLGVRAFFGSVPKRPQEESGFEDAAPLELDALFVERQPLFSDTTAQHSKSSVQH